MAFNIYAIEYLGFIVAGTLIAARSAGARSRGLVIAAITLGTVAFLLNPYAWYVRVMPPLPPEFVGRADPTGTVNAALDYDRQHTSEYVNLHWRPRFAELPSGIGDYTRLVALTTCAIGNGPVIATNYSWASLVRGQWDQIYFDEGGRPIAPAIWESAELLVSPTEGATAGSFASFPVTLGAYDVSRYAALMDRLPVAVITDQSAFRWRYLGGERLATCAAQFGYAATRIPGGSRQMLPGVPY
jgi:hypothetical protein